MSYDPSKPADQSPLSAAEMRTQLAGLHAIIPASVVVDSAQITSGADPIVSASLNSGVLHLSFGFPPGPPGEVSLNQLNNDIGVCLANAMQVSSANSNGVPELNLSPADPDVALVVAKLNELILALRR